MGEKFTEFRIYPQTPEHSKRIQQALRDLGYDWLHPSYKGTNQFLESEVLLTSKDGDILRVEKAKNIGGRVKRLPEFTLSGGMLIPVGNGDPYLLYPHSAVKRGPLGLMPRKLHDEQRLKDLLSAMVRFAEAGKEIPEDWIIELVSVNRGAQTPISKAT